LISLRAIRLPVLAAAAFLVAGCSSKIIVCPVPAILADTAQISVMRPGTTPDLANELYTVALTNAESDCTFAQRTAFIHASLDLTFRATRTPTAEAASYSVPFFVVVHENNKLYSKHIYQLRLNFAPGAATAVIKQSPEDTLILLENGKLPWNYQLLSGFQLTPEQMAYNAKRGRYVP
jgi:hypothetical protein